LQDLSGCIRIYRILKESYLAHLENPEILLKNPVPLACGLNQGVVDSGNKDDTKQRLRASHERVLATINSFETWDGKYDIAGALSILVHTAYHLGGIRVALGAIRAGNSA